MGYRAVVHRVVLLVFVAGCGPGTIKKLPISEEDRINSVRLSAEGDQLLREGKLHLALTKFLEASQFDPYSERIFNKIGVSYIKLDMLPQADRAIDRALGLNRNYAFGYNTKGILKLTRSDVGGAIKSFRQAIDLQSGVANFHVNLGFCLIQDGKYREALQAYRQALALNRDVMNNGESVTLNSFESSRNTPEGYYQLARVFANLDELDVCLSYLGKAISAGFSDFNRILEDQVFSRFEGNQQFENFLQQYGIGG